MKQRPEQRADDRQRASVRKEGHDAWDFACDVWAEAERQAQQMGRGFPSATLGDGGSGGSSDSQVERLSLEGYPKADEDADRDGEPTLGDGFRKTPNDPGAKASEWLSEFTEARTHLHALAIRARKLLPMDRPKDARSNAIDVCNLCDLPAPKVRRIDGVPYCATTCFYKVWRSKRDRAS
ncbi:MAG TPA: hypothetical protein VMZ73_09135 [Acidimicrobiales bacterium]|nr:hypothetical protein [Acidimicrobiales bacterium]